MTSAGYISDLVRRAQSEQREGRWADAEKSWSELLACAPDDSRGAIGIATCKLARGDEQDAEVAARELCETYPVRAAGFILLAQIASRRRQSAEAFRFWTEAFAREPANRTARTGHALALRWKLGQAVKDGDLLVARETFAALLNDHDAQSADATNFAALANLMWQDHRNDIRPLLCAFLKALPFSERRRAALRLSRVIYALSRGTTTVRESTTGAMRHRLTRAPVPPKSARLLYRVLDLQAKLEAHSQAALFDTDVARAQCERLIDIVHEHVAGARPFALTRMGDGEANCLPYPPDFAQFADKDASEREQVWWGRTIDPASRSRFASQVLSAFRESDAIGIPTISRFLRDERFDADDDLADRRSGRGLLAVLDAIELGVLADRLAGKIVTSAHVHQDFARWSLYPKLFAGLRHVSIVCCHPEIGHAMSGKFGVTLESNILIPPRAASRALMHAVSDETRVLPEMIDEVLAGIAGIGAGHMLVVSAGYLGKWIAGQARKQGAVALDLGSATDYWIGLKTRSLLDIA